jgi:hypothetical protein
MSALNVRFRGGIRLVAMGLGVVFVGISGWSVESGTSAGLSLLDLAAGRGPALADAGVSIPGDLGMAAYNPALIRTLKRPTLMTQFSTGEGDVNTGLFSFGRGGPRGGWGASLAFLDAGTIDLVTSGGDQRSRRAQQDWVASLTGATRLTETLSVGVAAKGIRSTLVQDETASALAADAGFLWRTPVRGWRFGGAAQNLGGKLTYREEGDPLPVLYRFGTSYTVAVKRWFNGGVAPDAWYLQNVVDTSILTFTADGVRDRAGQISGGIGFEWDVADRTAFRIGYKTGDVGEGVTAGVGFHLDRFSVDYAFQMLKDLKDRHRVALSLSWGE